MNVLELSEQEIIRRNSLNELRAMGIEPYPAAEYVTNAFSTDIKAEFKDDEEPRKVSVAGRFINYRYNNSVCPKFCHQFWNDIVINCLISSNLCRGRFYNFR